MCAESSCGIIAHRCGVWCTQPSDDVFGPSVYVAHELNLRTSLGNIRLIDTNLVDLHIPRLLALFLILLEKLEEVLPDLKRLVLDVDIEQRL
jgi:hypothetical protein